MRLVRALRGALRPVPLLPRAAPRHVSLQGRRQRVQYEHFRPQGRKSTSTLYVLGGVCGIGGIVFYVTHLDEVAYTGRSRVVALSESQELELGERAFLEVKSKFRSSLLPPQHPASREIQDIAMRIIRANGLADKYNWEVVVVHNPMINAFALPGGKICVFTGLMEKFRDRDALATVLGHEIGHVVARHSAEQLSWTQVLWLLHFGVAMMFNTTFLLDIVINFALRLPFSRKCEHEADRIGMIMMSKACFDPAVAPRVYKMLGLVHGGSEAPVYISTHPSSAQRVEKCQEFVSEARRIRSEQNCEFQQSLKQRIANERERRTRRHFF